MSFLLCVSQILHEDGFALVTRLQQSIFSNCSIWMVAGLWSDLHSFRAYVFVLSATHTNNEHLSVYRLEFKPSLKYFGRTYYESISS